MQPVFLPARRSVPTQATVVGFISAGIHMLGGPPDGPFERREKIEVPTRFRKQRMIAMRVQGDSMTFADGSGLPHGAYVLIDTDEFSSRYGHVYAFRTSEGELVAKRLCLYQGYPTMWSDNETHAPVRVDKHVQRLGRIYAYTLDLVEFQEVAYRSC